MINYIGIPCPVCKKTFEPDDDIVVCPDCGAPYHRNCYKETGHCLFEDKHDDDNNIFPFEENVKSNDASDKSDNFERTAICPNCLSRNLKSAHKCEKCGFPLPENQNSPQNNSIPSSFSTLYPNTASITFDPMGHIKNDEDFSGITAKELASYIKVNSAYYLPTFKRIKDSSTTRFNFSAFLFSGGWFLYRKQYKLGVIFTIIMFTLIISSICIEVLHNTPIITSLLSSTGINSNSGSLFSSQNMQNLMQQIMPLSPLDKLLLFAPTAISFLKFIVMMICGFIGNKQYMKHCVKTITKLKTKFKSTSSASNILSQKGGINKAIALSLLACYFIIIYFLKFALI